MPPSVTMGANIGRSKGTEGFKLVFKTKFEDGIISGSGWVLGRRISDPAKNRIEVEFLIPWASTRQDTELTKPFFTVL